MLPASAFDAGSVGHERSRDSPLWSTRMLGRGWLAFGLVMIALGGCGQHAPSDTNSKAKVRPELPLVKAAVLRVEERPWPAIVKTQGSLIADEVTVVGAKVAGRVAEVRVDLGDVVAANGPLA